MNARVLPMDHKFTDQPQTHANETASSVSVVMPVHNAETYLDRAIASVIGQRHSDFELLIIDDACEDTTAAIGRRWAHTDPRVRVVPSPSRGIVAALNHGIELATAPLIARVDGDDVCLPTRFETQCAYLAEHRDAVALGSGFAFVDEREQPLCIVEPPLDHEAILAAYARHEAMTLCHPTTMFRTQDARSIGGYDPSFQGIGSEDLDFFLRLARRGRLVNLPDVLLLVRKHATSYTRQTDFDAKAMHDARRRAVVRALSDLQKPIPAEPPQPSCAGSRGSSSGRLRMAFLAWWGGRWWTCIHHAWPALRAGPNRGQATLLITLSLLGPMLGGTLQRLWGTRYARRGRRRPGARVPASLLMAIERTQNKARSAIGTISPRTPEANP